jgi:hypothetical protein
MNLNLIKKAGAIFAASLLLFTSCSTGEKSSDALITINGEDIYLDEYMVYLDETVQNYELIGGEDIWETDFDGREAEEVAKESAYNSVVAVHITIENAAEYNVSLSETEESRAKTEAVKMAEDAGQSTESSYYETVLHTVIDKYIYAAVKEAVSKDIIISDAQIDAFCDENRENYEKRLMNVEAEVSYYDQYEKAQEDAVKFKEEGYENVSEGYKESISMAAGDFKEFFGISRDIVEGEIYGPVETETGYAVIYVKKCIDADKDFVEETMRSDYEIKIKDDIFNTQYDKWLSAAEITVNREIWDTIEIANAHK